MSGSNDLHPDTTASRFVKNAEGVLVFIITGLLAWVANSVHETQLGQVGLRAQVQYIIQVQDSTVTTLEARVQSTDERLATIWPRLRELKEVTNKIGERTKTPITWRAN